jgi:flagellar motility protein MotE (MotC chaperone)
MKRHILSAVIASWTAVALVGCGPDQAPVDEAAAPPAEESRILDRAVEAAKDASERASEAATATKDAASEAAASAAEQAGALRDRAEDEAKEMIEQVKTFLAEDKEPMARELMETLSAMKDSLSAALRAEIERLEAMFSDA